jgi:ribosomal protein L37AE/L43A
MILPDGTFIKADDFLALIKDAEVVECKCPVCKRMTSVEPLDNINWFCYECGTVFEC